MVVVIITELEAVILAIFFTVLIYHKTHPKSTIQIECKKEYEKKCELATLFYSSLSSGGYICETKPEETQTRNRIRVDQTVS